MKNSWPKPQRSNLPYQKWSREYVVNILIIKNKKYMKSIKNTFNKVKSKQPALGSYICLAEAVKNKHYTQDAISRAFTSLMPKDEYQSTERRGLIKQLATLSNTP